MKIITILLAVATAVYVIAGGILMYGIATTVSFRPSPAILPAVPVRFFDAGMNWWVTQEGGMPVAGGFPDRASCEVTRVYLRLFSPGLRCERVRVLIFRKEVER